MNFFQQLGIRTTASLLRTFPFPGRDRTFRAVESILGKNKGIFVVKLRGGGKLYVDGERDAQIYYLGEYQWNVRHFLTRRLQIGQTVFDLGANIGACSIPLALRVGSAGRVFAFEASRPNYQVLLKNVSLNSLTNLTCVFAAVVDRTGNLDVPNLEERSSFIGNYSLASESQTFVEIPAVSIDDFVEEHQIKQIDGMKIDIEGSETLAFRGGHDIFSRGGVKLVVSEVNPYWLKKMGSSPGELYDLFRSYDLDVFLLTRFATLQPIDLAFFNQAKCEFDVVLQPKR